MSDSEEENLVGQVLLGKLEVKRRLGGGGMGVVYEVEHRLTGHRRALKVVHAKYADRPRFMKRLLREAKVAGTLESKHVVETFDAGRFEDGSAYVLMELLKGRSLYEVMQAEGKLSAARMANIMCQVTEGMSVAHEAGIVHRDLKPENIFLLEKDADDNERVKILDFGVSKFDLGLDQAPNRLTAEGTLVGTPYYMSPEQAAGKAVDARSDVYAMGVILYEGLTGRLPFDADSVGELFVKIGAGECVPLRIRRPDIGEAWHDLVHRCFHRDPERRYASAEALRRDLLALAGSATTARARTISDGGRSTIDYDGGQAPGAARLPTLDDMTPNSGVHPMSDDEPSVPPPGRPDEGTAAPPPAAARPVPAWAWAVGGAIVVLLLTVPYALTRGDAPPDPAGVSNLVAGSTIAESPPADSDEPVDERGETTPNDVTQTPIVEGESDAGPGSSLEVRNNNRARAAGLDPNPYRR